MILIVDEEDGQVPLLIVHCKIVVSVPILVKPVVAKLGVVTLAVPDKTVQRPFPIIAGVAPKVMEFEQIV